jgi:hypothetical protein
MVPKATSAKIKATPIAAALENSGADGVDSVVPDGGKYCLVAERVSVAVVYVVWVICRHSCVWVSAVT